ncbi:MAG: GAF domain-containing protein [Gaiellaceae bacterium]
MLVVTGGGFFVTRAVGELNARRDSSHRAEIAATGVRDRVAQAATLVDGVRRFLAGPQSSEVTTKQFADIGARWLGPVGLPAAAWVERVPAAERAGYERRTGHPIVVPTSAGGLAGAGPRRTYLPATLVTGSPPMSTPGIDLGRSSGIAATVARPQTAYRVTATPLGQLTDGTTGLFLVQSAPRLNRGVVQPGFVVLFLPSSWLVAGAVDTAGSNPTASPRVQISVGNASSGALHDVATARSTFAAAGQTFEVRVPRRGAHGPAEVLPWIIAAGGLLLAALTGALEVIAARRATAKAELDRLFTLTPDLIAVAGFDGYFKRVNPAFGAHLGYTQLEALARPYVEFVHPDDRERTQAESSLLRKGMATVSFENRYLCKDGSYRWIEWTATPVLDEQLMYAVGRDVTERRRTEAEQAALRRVATLVARAVSPPEVFAGTAAEIRRLLGSDFASLGRYESDGTLTNLAHADGGAPDANVAVVGTRVPVEGESAAGVVLRTGHAARMSLDRAAGPVADLARTLGVKTSVGAPIVVEGRLWGVIVVSTKGEPLPADTERRLADFTELVATGIADAESRSALGRLARQQAALRRVATLVAEGVPPAEVLAAVGEEVYGLLNAQTAVIARLEDDGTYTVVANCGITTDALAVGTRRTPEPEWVVSAVIDTGRSARKDNYANTPERIPGVVRDLGIRSSVGAPILVEGALWGVIIVGTLRERFPEDTEQHLEEFTELAATAIANAESRSELAASRARIVGASDETRRRIERDLHDGTQQRLVSLGLELRLAESTVPAELEEARRTIGEVARQLNQVIDELREISRGIHPAILSEGGLGPALRTLARRSAIPVELAGVIDERLPEPVEVAAYYVVSEALTNTAKHANASRVDVVATVRDTSLRLWIRDDGGGGANPAGGTGLIGLRDRVEALGGSIEVNSPPGRGTELIVELPRELDLTPGKSTESPPPRIPASR